MLKFLGGLFLVVIGLAAMGAMAGEGLEALEESNETPQGRLQKTLEAEVADMESQLRTEVESNVV